MRTLLLWLATCLTLNAGEHRIASYSPGATQTLIDLGCSAEIVMATRWCPMPKDHPAARNADVFLPDLERLLETKPDLVILPRMANPLWAEKCAKAGLRTIVLNREASASVSADILLIGEATGRSTEANRLATVLRKRPTILPRTVVVIWDGVMAGPDSYLSEPLAAAGLKPALPKGSWIKFDWELLALSNPEAVLWIQNASTDGPIEICPEKIGEMRRLPAIKELSCLKKGRIYQVNSGSNCLPGSGLTKLNSQLMVIRNALGP
jgi:ABC-type Fe3+-hydroxamate transport system substrate-binding protein